MFGQMPYIEMHAFPKGGGSRVSSGDLLDWMKRWECVTKMAVVVYKQDV